MSEQDEPRHPDSALIAKLNEGEYACLTLVTEGLGSKEIARKIGISPHTVDARLKSACQKLRTRSRFVAARMLEDARRRADDVTVTGSDTNLAYEKLVVPTVDTATQEGASAGQGDGPGDIKHQRQHDPVSERDSGEGRSWLEPSHPIAKFFGGENNLRIGKRLLYIIVIAIGSAIAFGVLVNGLLGISKIFSSS